MPISSADMEQFSSQSTQLGLWYTIYGQWMQFNSNMFFKKKLYINIEPRQRGNTYQRWKKQ